MESFKSLMFQIESLAGQMQRSLKIRLVFCVFATFLHSNLLTHVTADQAYGQTYLQEASLVVYHELVQPREGLRLRGGEREGRKVGGSLLPTTMFHS